MLDKDEIFEGDSFALQIISVGSFVDDGCGNGKLYQVAAAAVRLNHVAYNEWLSCRVAPDREDFDSAAEWEAAKLDRVKRFEAWTKDILTALHIESPNIGSVSISRAHAEVFTVVHVREIAAEKVPEHQP